MSDAIQSIDQPLSRLRSSATLGKPLGCLKIAPGPGLSKMATHHVQYAAFIFFGIVVAAVTILAAVLLPDLSRTAHRALPVGVVVAIVMICVAIMHLRLSDARTVEVYERGLRFGDRSDAPGVREQFLWDEVDNRINRATIQKTVGFELWRITCKYRLKGFSVAERSHEISLIVTHRERSLAEFVLDKLGCDMQE